MNYRNFIDKTEVFNPVELCKQLIRINSENPKAYEKDIAAFVRALLKNYGVPHTVIVSGKNRYNIIANYEGRTSDKLVFNGHLDTKPAGKGWLTNPFEPNIKAGKMYGLGSSDMKGGIACMLSALIYLKERRIIPESNLELQFVADEEMNSEYGTKHLIKTEKISTSSLAIIAEPTRGKLITRSLGNAWRRLKLYGKKAHAGNHHEGLNAAYYQALFVQQMKEAITKYRYIHDKDYKRFPNFNIGSVTAIGHPGTVTDYCEMTFEVRFKSEEERYKYDAVISTILDKLKDKFGIDYTLDEFGGGGIPPMRDSLLSANETIRKKINKISHIINGGSAQSKNISSAWNGGCDGGYISQCTSTPAIVIGPGSLMQAHQANEWVNMTELKKTFGVFKKIMTEI